MNEYDIGDEVRCKGNFATALGVATDPTAVFFKVRAPNGTETLYTYGTDAELQKASVGNYYVDVDATISGTWYYSFYSTGAGKTAGTDKFVVKHSPFAPEVV